MKAGTSAMVVLSLLAACSGGDTPPPPAAGTAPAAAPRVVELTATEYAFDAPDTIPAGWTTLRLANRGGEIHYGHIVRLDSGRTVEELVDAYAEAIRTSGPRPKWVTRFGGPGGVAPGGTSVVTQRLEPGEYVWICPIEDESGAPHFGKGEVKRFVVADGADEADEADEAEAPRADVVVRLMDFDFALDSAPAAGKHTIQVENAGVEPHDLVLFKLAPGATLEQLRTWLNPEKARRDVPAGEPEPSFESLVSVGGGVAAMAPGMQAFFEMDLTPGDYVLACMATAPDGRSHIEHGMIRQVTIREPGSR
ncbi:MAG TPA: hypothetical protein VF037_01260 [Gemmatimonadales bacterium]